MVAEVTRYVAPQAWVDGAWTLDVLLAVAADGTWASIEPNAVEEAQRGAVRLAGPVLAGLVNAHSPLSSAPLPG